MAELKEEKEEAEKRSKEAVNAQDLQMKNFEDVMNSYKVCLQFGMSYWDISPIVTLIE